jgi:hypothetical protein
MSCNKITSQINKSFLLAGDPEGLWFSHGPSQASSVVTITFWLDKFREWKCKQLKVYKSKVILVTLVVKTSTPPSFMFSLYSDAQEGKHTLLILPCSTSNSSSYLISWKRTLIIQSLLMKLSSLSSPEVSGPSLAQATISTPSLLSPETQSQG